MITFDTKLERALLLLNEDISKQDFFDLYGLIYAYQKHKTKPLANALMRLGTKVLKDGLDQLGSLISTRFLENDSVTNDAQIHYIHKQFGLPNDLGDTSIYDLMPIKFKKLSNTKQIAFVRALKPHNNRGVWNKWADAFLDIITTAFNGPEQLISGLDRFFNLIHHGGKVSMYMNEKDWLEDALNVRDNMSFNQLYNILSSKVKAIIDNPQAGSINRAVSGILTRLGNPMPALDLFGRGPTQSQQFDGVTIPQKILSSVRSHGIPDGLYIKRLNDGVEITGKEASVVIASDGNYTTFEFSNGYQEEIQSYEITSIINLLDQLAWQLKDTDIDSERAIRRRL